MLKWGQLPFNFANTNWKSLEAKLKEYLPNPIDPNSATATELDHFALQIVTALQQAISETTPRNTSVQTVFIQFRGYLMVCGSKLTWGINLHTGPAKLK
jgi:hypothetical protein